MAARTTYLDEAGPGLGAALVTKAGLGIAIMLGGALNGLAVRMIEAWEAGGASIAMGVSPFQIIALLVACRLSLGGTSKVTPLWLDAVALALILVPSSTVSWGAVAIYAAVIGWRAEGEQRAGALLFLAVALVSLWSSVGLKWLAGPVTTVEAWAIGKMMGMIDPAILQSGNVIGTPGVHSLVLMTACTTTDALPLASVALVSVSLLLGKVDRARMPWALAILAVVYFVANSARMGAMAWSGDLYELWHGPIGSNVFDLGQTIAVLALGNWASRP